MSWLRLRRRNLGSGSTKETLASSPPISPFGLGKRWSKGPFFRLRLYKKPWPVAAPYNKDISFISDPTRKTSAPKQKGSGFSDSGTVKTGSGTLQKKTMADTCRWAWCSSAARHCCPDSRHRRRTSRSRRVQKQLEKNQGKYSKLIRAKAFIGTGTRSMGTEKFKS